MADVTWGVKVSEELKERIAGAMQDAGLSGKEFVESLLQSYEIDRLKEAQPVMKADLDELQLLTSRMYGIFASLGERIENIDRAKEAEYKAEIEGKNGTISMYYNKIKEHESLASTIKQEKSELEARAAEVEKRNVELLEMSESNKALVVEYKEKNDTLTGLLNEYKEYKEVNVQLKAEILKLQQNNRETEDKLATNAREKEHLTEKVAAIEEKNRQEITDINTRNKELIETIRNQEELDKGNALLQLRNEYQAKIEENQSKIAFIQDEHSSKVKALLDHIEKLQNEKILKAAKPEKHTIKEKEEL